MNLNDQIKKELNELIDNSAEIMKEIREFREEYSFHLNYQVFYSKSLKIVKLLAPDRYEEFKNYYEINSKRKKRDITTYVIQDYIKGVSCGPSIDHIERVIINLYAQHAILNSIRERIDSVLFNLDEEIFFEITDKELAAAANLLKTNIRAAGALAGVILEGYLQRIAKKHNVKITKKNPTIGDLNGLLKKDSIYDNTTHQKILYFSTIRNLCSHKKDIEPTKEQVSELITGVNWAMKNIF